MRKYSVFIVDDLELEYNLIAGILSGMDRLQIVSNYDLMGNHPYTKAIEYIKFQRPDIIIVDHDLRESDHENGLTLFLTVNNPKLFCIFMSNYPEKAADNGLAGSNTVYINKSEDRVVLLEKLQRGIEMGMKYLAKVDTDIFTVEINDDPIKVKYSNIVYLKAQGKNTLLYLFNSDEPILIRQLFKNFIEDHTLVQKSFIQIHKSYIVNSKRLKRINRAFLNEEKKFLNRKILVAYIEIKDLATEIKKLPVGGKFENSPEVLMFRTKYIVHSSK